MQTSFERIKNRSEDILKRKKTSITEDWRGNKDKMNMIVCAYIILNENYYLIYSKKKEPPRVPSTAALHITVNMGSLPKPWVYQFIQTR